MKTTWWLIFHIYTRATACEKGLIFGKRRGLLAPMRAANVFYADKICANAAYSGKKLAKGDQRELQCKLARISIGHLF